ncbi:hypothetical protein IFM89_028399 [Coptis chinensis]|uniref:ABC1 atypical kinase-like domain-containing protein n=1 Tax=Coptis chinensis TaxID=261450 RepID=A0A835LGR5_9MAGN|nr:hypothetical protein IFM89_028399 [Coptis chinensis]
MSQLSWEQRTNLELQRHEFDRNIECAIVNDKSGEVVQLVLERELGCSVGEVFERFDAEPLGSASIAQVHRARLKGAKGDVAVKVQHPGGQDLMMTDIHNLQAFSIIFAKVRYQI